MSIEAGLCYQYADRFRFHRRLPQKNPLLGSLSDTGRLLKSAELLPQDTANLTDAGIGPDRAHDRRHQALAAARRIAQASKRACNRGVVAVRFGAAQFLALTRAESRVQLP